MRETPEALGDEVASDGDPPAEVDDESRDSLTEPAFADTASVESGLPPAQAAGESAPLSAGQASLVSEPAPATPNRPYFGPITRLNELPQHVLRDLDEESAAKLKAVLDNPDPFNAEILVGTTIQSQYEALPRAAGPDYEPPWYHEPLPPLRLELVLVKYDWIVEDVIDRAARRIDQRTDGKLDSRLEQLLFKIRSEIRTVLR